MVRSVFIDRRLAECAIVEIISRRKGKKIIETLMGTFTNYRLSKAPKVKGI